jgi:hypothetical protein
MTTKISSMVKYKLMSDDYNNGYLMLKHLEALYQPKTEWAMLMVFAELITLSPENMTLEDYLIKHKSLIERIDKSGIKLTSEK